MRKIVLEVLANNAVTITKERNSSSGDGMIIVGDRVTGVRTRASIEMSPKKIEDTIEFLQDALEFLKNDKTSEG